MTTLVSICGGAEQAAYAIVWRPELLELESAASLRESLQAMRDHVGSLVGFGWFWLVDLKKCPNKIDGYKKQTFTYKKTYADGRNPVYLHGFMNPQAVQDVFLVRRIM